MCEICLHTPCVPRCPNYMPTVCYLTCEECEEPIMSGDEYILTPDGHAFHTDCADFRDIMESLGCEFKTYDG